MVALRAQGTSLRAIAAEMQEISATWACRASYASDGPLEGDRQDDRGDGKSTDRRAAIKPCSVGSDAHVECRRTSALNLLPQAGRPFICQNNEEKMNPDYMVVANDELGVYSIHEVSDVGRATAVVMAEQKKGRKVRCSVSNTFNESAAEREAESAYPDYHHVEDALEE